MLVLIFIFASGLLSIQAQCPMCRASLESNRASGGKEGNGINKGIIYLLVFPYLLIGSLGFYYYYAQKKRKKQMEMEEVQTVEGT